MSVYIVCTVWLKETLSYSGSEEMIKADFPVRPSNAVCKYWFDPLVIISTLFFSKQQGWLLFPLKDEEFFLEPLLNSGIGCLIFLCCFRGKTSKQVLLQSRIFSFLHFQSFMMMTVCMQAILRLCSTYSQAVHSAAYCIFRTRLAKFVILCLKEQTFLNVNNMNVFCATLFCIWMYFFFSLYSWFFLLCDMFVGSHPHWYPQPLFVSGLLNRLHSV